MPDWEKEYAEAKRTLQDHEKRIKSLEQRLDAEHEETKKVLSRLRELETKVQSLKK